MVVQEPQNILAWEPESTAALQYFESTAWCGELLRQPELRLFCVQYEGRKPRGWDPVVHGLLAERNTTGESEGEGVLHFLSGMLVPTDTTTTAIPALDSVGGGPAPALYGGGARRPHNAFPQHVNFYALGRGVAGHLRTVHGGVLALLVDSAFAQLGFVHGRPGTRFYSAYTNTRFVRPVMLPGDDEASPAVEVVVSAQVDSRRTREGDRKIFVLARVEGADGVVFVTAEGLLVGKVLDGAAKL